MKKIAVLISGNGTNLEAIINGIKDGNINGKIEIVISDNSEAYGLVRADNYGIRTHVASGQDLFSNIEDKLSEFDIDLIVLAGFMRILPERLVERYKSKIINLHPSLLPKYGGKGMYGDHVHEAVLKANDKNSGATVHYVDKGCDTGEIIAQERVNVYNFDDIESLGKRIHDLEHRLLPRVVSMLCE